MILGDVLRARGHRVRDRDGAHRARRTTGVREVVVHRLPAVGAGRTRRRESTLDTWHQVLWCVHVAAFLVFLLVLPITMLRHMFTSPLNMYLRDRDRPKGAMRAMPNLTETELETFGAATVEDFTWKQLLDTDACTMCGRCTSVCPAHATGKPLDPREIVLKTRRGHGRDRATRRAAADRRRFPRSPSRPTRCSSASRPRRCGRARRARRATRSAR